MTTLTDTRRRDSVLTALGAVAVYLLLAAGLGNLLGGLLSEDQEMAAFALGHLIPLPIAIALLLLYVRWAGTSAEVWRERPTPTLTPHRWWLVTIPVLATATSVIALGDVAWAERSLGLIAVVALGTLLVGVGEELAIRGILLTAVRARHGEFVTLLVTALVFALAHIPGSIISGLPMAFIALQVGGLAIAGATYYWIRRVTGRLWVGILVHAFTDWVLYLGAASTVPSASMPQDHKASTDGVTGYIEIVLWIALTIGVVSVIR